MFIYICIAAIICQVTAYIIELINHSTFFLGNFNNEFYNIFTKSLYIIKQTKEVML